MSNSIILAVAILAPVVILTALRVDAALAFLSLCLGYVLVHFVSGDAVSLLTALFPHASAISQSTIRVAFLWLPVALTVIAMFHSVRGTTKVLLNILPAIGVGVLGLLLVEPSLSPGIRGALAASSYWRQFEQAQTLIVGLSALISLVFLWLQRPMGKSEHKRH